MFREISILAVAACTAGPLAAQQSLLGPGAAFISVGVARVATSGLDDRLAANGYPTFGQQAKSAGVGGYRVLSNKVMLGAELSGFNFDEKPHNGRMVGVGGGAGTIGVGFMKDVSPRLRVYPRLGLGAGGLTLWVESADTVTFDSVLADPQPVPGRQRLLSRDGGVIDFGFGAEIVPKDRGGALIGLRAGYLMSSFGSSSDWWLQNGTATGGPEASISGAYLRMTLGGAWKR
jgi:hypothetical protein